MRDAAASAAAAAAGVTSGSTERTIIPRSASAWRTSFGAPTTSSEPRIGAGEHRVEHVGDSAGGAPHFRPVTIARRDDAGTADDDAQHAFEAAPELQQIEGIDRYERTLPGCGQRLRIGDRDAQAGESARAGPDR